MVRFVVVWCMWIPVGGETMSRGILKRHFVVHNTAFVARRIDLRFTQNIQEHLTVLGLI